jgi:hypothetical protein
MRTFSERAAAMRPFWPGCDERGKVVVVSIRQLSAAAPFDILQTRPHRAVDNYGPKPSYRDSPGLSTSWGKGSHV